MRIQVIGHGAEAEVLDLPWPTPLPRWSDPRLVRMARGPSRHIVRFVEMSGRVYAVKETTDDLAEREYRLLRDMTEAGLPVVAPVASVTGRADPRGGPLPGAVVTRYLDFSLPYSYLLAHQGSLESQHQLVDAAAVLLVQIHLEGFWWGDCSLANMLFRRDAGSLAAYLVDAETVEHHDRLGDHLREADVELAVENLALGAADLVAAGRAHARTDALGFATQLDARYRELWSELTVEEEIPTAERWRLGERVRRLNRLGFDANEISIRSGVGRDRTRIRPSIVEEGHHARRLSRLTGIDVQENQARRLLNDLESFRATIHPHGGRRPSEGEAAYRWMTEVFEPFVASIPSDLADRLEPAEAYHQYLEHRWFLSETHGRAVPDDEALSSFVEEVLRRRPEERLVLPDQTDGPAPAGDQCPPSPEHD